MLDEQTLKPWQLLPDAKITHELESKIFATSETLWRASHAV